MFLDIDSNCEEDQMNFEELEPGITDTVGISEEDKISTSSCGSSKSLHYDIQQIRNISSQLSMSRHHMNRHMSTIETQTQNQNWRWNHNHYIHTIKAFFGIDLIKIGFCD